MQISSDISTRNYFQHSVAAKMTSSDYERFSTAVSKGEEVEGEEKGEFLGLTMLPEEGSLIAYGMVAVLSKNSTPAHPIVQVISELGGNREIYDVDINKVNPAHASRLEMFALCCYADKCGMGTGSTFGSYHTFKMYERTAQINGCIRQVSENESAWDQFRNEKEDWINICESVLNILKTSTDSKVLDLFSKGKKLLNLYSKFTASLKLN